MPTTTRDAAKKKNANKPVQPILKIKLTPGQVRSAIRLSVAEEERAAIEKEALTLSKAPRVPAEGPPLESSVTDTEDEPGHEPDHCSDVEGEEAGASTEEPPLFLSNGADDQSSLAMEDRDPWETEPEWTGLGGSEAVSISEDDVNMADKSPRKIVKLVTREKPKAKLGKPLMIRDLVRAQVRAENQLNTPGLKKRKLTDDGNGPTAKRIVSKSGAGSSGDGFTVRPGFLEDDDMETIQQERKAIKGQKGKLTSKSIVKVTHENAPLPTAEEKRKKSSVSSCYLKDFNAKFVSELIRHVSDDGNPWQPTFDAESVIEKIRRQVYPNIMEKFKGKDPLLAPAFNKVTNWRAAIGRRALGVVKTYFGDKGTFDNAEEIKEHVQWLLPNKDEEIDEEVDKEEDDNDEGIDVEEIVRRRKKKFVGAPFLYENGLIGPVEEPPSGYLLSPLVLNTFAIHFETTGINADPITCKRQVGALALALTAVERAVSCWETGKEERPSKAFSQAEYGATTQEYIEALLKVPEGHWELVLASTRRYTPWKQDTPKPKEKPSARARVPAGL